MSQCILIVEDDPAARDLFNRILRAEGFETAYAADAYEALVVARRCNPALVLLDYHLPGGDAVVVLERLRRVASLALVPILVVSAFSRVPTEQQVLDAGAARFLQKPVDIPVLLAAVRAELEPPEPTAQALRLA